MHGEKLHLFSQAHVVWAGRVSSGLHDMSDIIYISKRPAMEIEIYYFLAKDFYEFVITTDC